jgi:hypothetical protein
MIVQAYNDGEVHVFKGQIFLYSFTVRPPLKGDIDKHLKLLRMRRRTKWTDTSWGSTAEVGFVEK